MDQILGFNSHLSKTQATLQILMIHFSLLQPGKRKAGVEGDESSDDCEDLLEKVKRMCLNYASDEDPDYEVWLKATSMQEKCLSVCDL
jgi:hypothetical protein